MRYDRQIILPEIGEEGQKKLQEAKVLIVGVGDRKSTRLNSSHNRESRMPSSA